MDPAKNAKDGQITAESAVSLSRVNLEKGQDETNNASLVTNPGDTQTMSHSDLSRNAKGEIYEDDGSTTTTTIVSAGSSSKDLRDGYYNPKDTNVDEDGVDSGNNNYSIRKRPAAADSGSGNSRNGDRVIEMMADNDPDQGQQTTTRSGMPLEQKSVASSSVSDGGKNKRGTGIISSDDVCKMFGVMFAVGVRLALFAFCFFLVWLVVFRLQSDWFWLLACTFIFLIIETLNIVISRAGQERKWICLCFLCYLCTAIPCVWLLELDRLETFQRRVNNESRVIVEVAGVTADVKLDPNTLLSVTEQCLVFLLILARWLLPRGDISRDQLSQLLFVYIGMASDVMELFELFDEYSVRKDRTLTCVILTVWSLSMLQFCLVLTMSASPKKIRTAIDHTEEDDNPNQSTCCAVVFVRSEMWSLVVALFMQDGPFLAVRLYTLLTYQLMTYSIIFFTCKNILVIMLLFYRSLVICVGGNRSGEKIGGKRRTADADGPTSKAISTTATGYGSTERSVTVQ